MKTFAAPFAILIAVAGWLQADNIPQGYEADRYEALWKRSPFTLSSIADDANAAPTGLAERFSLGGLFTIANKDYIFVIDKTKPTEHLLVSSEPNDMGLSLESVHYDAALENTTAKIKMGEETGVIRFDPTALAAATPPQPQMPPNMPPGMPQRPFTPMPNSMPNPPQRINRPRIIAPPSGIPPTNH